MLPNGTDYTYASAGYNRFFKRTIGQVNTANSLQNTQKTTTELNYDTTQMSGSLGSIVNVGRIKLDGVNGRITLEDKEGNVSLLIGEDVI